MLNWMNHNKMIQAFGIVVAFTIDDFPSQMSDQSRPGVCVWVYLRVFLLI